LGLREDAGNVVEARQNLAALTLVVGTGDTEGFSNRGEGLLDIEVGVALPALENVELPMNAGECRTDEAMVDLLRDGRVWFGESFPAGVECGECCALAGDVGWRPVTDDAEGTFHARDVIAGVLGVAGAPCPEIGCEFLVGVGSGLGEGGR